MDVLAGLPAVSRRLSSPRCRFGDGAACCGGVRLRSRTNRRSILGARCLLPVLVFVGWAGLCSAQTNVESNAAVQLDFLNPGARGLALGGAFVGVADDATAAFTNPAGLTGLSQKELSAEGRYWRFQTPYTSGGRLSGVATRQGIDVSAGVTEGQSRQALLGASFLSFVYPGTHWALAAYRQQLASFRYEAQSTGPFVSLNNIDARLNPYRATLHVDIARYGVSGAYTISDRLSVGVGTYVYEFSLHSETRRFPFDPNLPQFFAAPDFSAPPAQVQTQDGTHRAIGVNLGVLASPHPRVRIGGVFRQGAGLGIRTTDVTNSRVTSADGTFTVPDTFGLGTLIKLTEQVHISADYDRVRYSQITRKFSVFFAPLPGYSAQPQDFKADDANEVHVGLEYLFLHLRHPIALSAGSWFDPDHAVRFEPLNAQLADPYNLTVFRRGKDVVHATFGAGLVFPQFEISAAADISSKTSTASLSTVIRF